MNRWLIGPTSFCFMFCSLNMPTFKVNQGKRQLFSQEDLNNALKAVIEDKIPVRRAAEDNGIDRTTLGRYCLKARKEGRAELSKASMVTTQVGCL